MVVQSSLSFDVNYLKFFQELQWNNRCRGVPQPAHHHTQVTVPVSDFWEIRESPGIATSINFVLAFSLSVNVMSG